MQLGLLAAGAAAAGALHVVTGPDHLTAVLPLALEHRRRAVSVGAWWGVGHGLGVGVWAAIGALFVGALDLTALSSGFEIAIGALLVALGSRALWRARSTVRLAGSSHAHHHRAFGFGLLHGAAGGGHLLAALPALALRGGAAAWYVSAYFVGAVASMSLFALLCGGLVPDHRVPSALRGAAVLAIAVGIFWIGAAVVAA